MGASQSANKTNAPKSSNASSANKRNNTNKNNKAPVVWNGKVLPPATPAGQKSNINSNWKPAANKKSRRKTRRKTRRNRK